MKRFVFLFAIMLAVMCVFASCDKPDVIEVIDGYIVVNGVKTEYEVKNNNHLFSEWKLYNEDETNCEKKLYYRVCSDCSMIEWKDGSYADHTWNTVTTEPTCQAEGYDTKTCTSCGAVEVCNQTPVSDHSYPDEYITNNSFHYKKCINCDYTTKQEEHTIGDDGVCSVCDAIIGDTEGIIYDVSADGTYAEVIGYEGTATKVKIADTYKGLPVKTIYSEAFYENKTITSVIIPDSVTTIGYEAFSNCYSLTSVVIGDSVTTIGGLAFYGCSSLTSVVIGDSVTSIGEWAFYNCDRLTSVVIGDSVTTIGNQAFYNCSSLKFNEYENGKYLGTEDNPYFALIELTTKNLSSYTIHEDTKIIANRVFYECERLTSITIPDSVTTIDDDAFYCCSNLTSVVIPDSVTTIGNAAFAGCYALRDVYYTGSEEEWKAITIGSSDYYLTNATKHYNYVPEG